MSTSRQKRLGIAIASGLALVLIVVAAFVAGRSSGTGGTDDVAADLAADPSASSDASGGTPAAPTDPGTDPSATASSDAAADDAGSELVVTPVTKAPKSPPPVRVSTSGTEGLADGSVVDIHVDAEAGSQLYGIEVRICAGDTDIHFLADFNPTQTGLCVLGPLSPETDSFLATPTLPPYQSADLAFRVGAGTDSYSITEQLGGRAVEISCDATHPCQLVIKVQVPDEARFVSLPLTFS